MAPAAQAFDAVAETFDSRFTPWLSVAAQRRAVRAELAAHFPSGARLIEIGGGTGEDARWLAKAGRRVLLTDPSPAMVAVAAAKLAGVDAQAAVCAAEDIGTIDATSFDGAFSNFAGLNCVGDLASFAEGLAGKIRPGGSALLVLFGTRCLAEILVEAVRGRPANMFRRCRRGDIPAKLGGQHFTVRYHRRRDLVAAMAPWFDYRGRRGIGLFVPPSAAEPWISRHPRLLDILETLDRRLAGGLAMFGDHILYRFERNTCPA